MAIINVNPSDSIQEAIDDAAFYDTIQLADGTYTQCMDVVHLKFVTIKGNAAHPENVVIDIPAQKPGLWVQDHAVCVIGDLTLMTSNANVIGIQSRQYAIVDFFNIRFGSMSGHVSATESSKINGGASNVIYGGAVYHGQADMHSVLLLPCAYTLTGTPAFSAAFYIANNMALIDAFGASYSGAATGTRFIAEGASIIRYNNQIPGNVAGSCYHQSQAF